MVNIPLRVTRGDGDVATASDGSVHLETDTGGAEGLGDIFLLARLPCATVRRGAYAGTLLEFRGADNLSC